MSSDNRKSLSEVVADLQSSLLRPSLASVTAGGIVENIRKMQESNAAFSVAQQIKSANVFNISRQNIVALQSLSASAQLEKARALVTSIGEIEQLRNIRDFQMLSSYQSFSSGAEWIGKHKSSALLDLITNHTLSPANAEAFRKLELEVSADLDRDIELINPPQIIPKLEAEIVEVIEQGRDFSELSGDALRYLKTVWVWLWCFLNNSAAIVTLVLALGSFDDATTSEAVREQVKTMPPVTRQLLDGNSVVTGDHVIVRAKPNKNSSELVRLKVGTLVENLGGDTDTWTQVQVEVGGQEVTGWIARRYLVEF